MKKYLILGLLFVNVIVACGRVPKLGPETAEKLATASEKSCGFVQNSYGQRVSWKKSLPIKIYVDPSFPPEHDPVLKQAAKKWEDVLGRTLFLFERAPLNSPSAKDNRNVVYWANPWSETNKNLQAVSALSWSNNQLVEADVKVNAEHYRFSSILSATSVDLESLIVHELGHVLGLTHLANGTSTVMLQVLDYNLKRDIPSAEDIANLKCEYN